MHRRAHNPGRLGLELGPELIPVDEIRPDQRGYQRNDQGYRQPEQCRLHGVSLAHAPAAALPDLARSTRRAADRFLRLTGRDHPPARRAKINAETALYIERSVAKSQQ